MTPDPRTEEIRAREGAAVPDLYLVVHEAPISPERTDYGAASSIHDKPPVNELAYCRAMQERGQRGSEGRYFIAKLTEVPNADD